MGKNIIKTDDEDGHTDTVTVEIVAKVPEVTEAK